MSRSVLAIRLTYFSSVNLDVRVDFHSRVIFPCVNEVEAMYERPRVNMKVERGSTFTFTRDLPYTLFTLFTSVKFTCIRTEKLRDNENQP